MTAAAPKPAALREAIAVSVRDHLKAQNVERFCVDELGLTPAGPNEDPFKSKQGYVDTRLQPLDTGRLLVIAQRVLQEWDDPVLESLLAQANMRGVHGEVKNLIFAADGPKPQIVLRDAINNVIDITRHAEHCLVYDRPLPTGGLSWADLVSWWEDTQPSGPETAARTLWRRLHRSLASEPERRLFTAYTARYRLGFDQPALIPQVYLHYDPYLRGSPLSDGAVVRQRMDFLLLLPDRARVVLEVDGRHHYADSNGAADPPAYSKMTREDRRLRLTGYELYRFGAEELLAADGQEVLDEFFDQLLTRHSD